MVPLCCVAIQTDTVRQGLSLVMPAEIKRESNSPMPSKKTKLNEMVNEFKQLSLFWWPLAFLSKLEHSNPTAHYSAKRLPNIFLSSVLLSRKVLFTRSNAATPIIKARWALCITPIAITKRPDLAFTCKISVVRNDLQNSIGLTVDHKSAGALQWRLKC